MRKDAGVIVRRLDPAEWRTARAVRLRALQESADAFASSYGEEVDRPDDWWVSGMSRLAWFVAEQDGEVVGVVAGMPVGDSPEVMSMWVEPEHRGSAVAQDLLAGVVAWAEAQGAVALCLAVAQDNHIARRFYERAGFVPRGPGEALRSRPEVCTTEMRRTL